jgi:hypothetical protein
MSPLPPRRCRQCRGSMRGKRPQAVYCSVACRNQAYIARRREERQGDWGGPPYVLDCWECGRSFERQTLWKNRHVVFCSTRCRVRAWRFMRGGRLYMYQ